MAKIRITRQERAELEKQERESVLLAGPDADDMSDIQRRLTDRGLSKAVPASREVPTLGTRLEITALGLDVLRGTK